MSSIINYTIKLPSDQLQPAKAFWSMTMCNLPQRILVAYPINRHPAQHTDDAKLGEEL